jgi:hypothetical protein
LSEDPSPDIRLDKSEESYETRETSAWTVDRSRLGNDILIWNYAVLLFSSLCLKALLTGRITLKLILKNPFKFVAIINPTEAQGCAEHRLEISVMINNVITIHK